MPSARSEAVEGRPSFSMADNASFEIVFKIQETCNINCTYCYMYNVGNDLHKIVPKSSSLDTCTAVAEFFCDQFQQRSPRYGRLILHGGEPLLMPQHQLERRMQCMSAVFDSRLSIEQQKKVQIGLQTNATLVTDSWIDFIAKWNIGVGVSIDGPADVHDANRVTHRGEGTHAQTVAGLRLLQKAAADGRLSNPPGGLCVINPEADGAEVFDYLTSDLGLESIDFLFPFMTWDNYSSLRAEGVRRFLASAFRAWLTRKDDFKRVRLFSNILTALRHGASDVRALSSGILPHYVVIVESDGTIMPEESLRPTYPLRLGDRSILRDPLVAIMGDPVFQDYLDRTLRRSEECVGCALLDICGSGFSLGRVGFKHSSSGVIRKPVYCTAFIDLFVEGAAAMRQSDIAIHMEDAMRVQAEEDGAMHFVA